MKIILAGNISPNVSNALESRGFEIIKSPCNSRVLKGLCYHPDMQIVNIDNTLICDPALYEYYRKAIGDDCTVIPGDTVCSCNYPEDIAYNVKVIKDTVFHNFKYTDSCVLSHLSRKTLIDVPQGYSGCSICNVCDRGIITADRKIQKKAIENGTDALLIKPGNIKLEGFDYGFIGGASFCHNNVVYFFGNIDSHPDSLKIKDFCTEHHAEICQLTEDNLSDFGSAIVID